MFAVDIGNTRLKFGWFPRVAEDGLPVPTQTFDLRTTAGADEWRQLERWLPAESPAASWWIGSVHRPSTTTLVEWIRGRNPTAPLRLLSAGDLPLRTRVVRADLVGIDRLLGGVAANALRQPERPAIVVSLGTAITVNRIATDGAFEGGAILPGIGMSARALHEFTDLLPLIPMQELADPPPPLGTETIAAMRAGLFWGAVGGVRELIAQLCPDRAPQIFLTGGAAPSVAPLLGDRAEFVPHLTLGGIALAARSLRTAP